MENVTIKVPGAQTSATDKVLIELTTQRAGAKERGETDTVARLTKAIEGLGFTVEDRGKRTTIIKPIA